VAMHQLKPSVQFSSLSSHLQFVILMTDTWHVKCCIIIIPHTAKTVSILSGFLFKLGSFFSVSVEYSVDRILSTGLNDIVVFLFAVCY